MLAEPFDVEDGWMVLSDAPGLGVILDEKRLATTVILASGEL